MERERREEDNSIIKFQTSKIIVLLSCGNKKLPGKLTCLNKLEIEGRKVRDRGKES